MKRTLLTCLVYLVFSSLNAMQTPGELTPPTPTVTAPASPWSYTFSSLREALKTNVDNKGLEIIDVEDPRLPATIELDEFLKAFDQCAKVIQTFHYNNPWVQVPGKLSMIPDRSYELIDVGFHPYAQKMIVPTNSTIAFWGDLHGSASSLMRDLENLYQQGVFNNDFKITKDNFYMVFLGDVTDRGSYSTEVLYILLRLKIANPEKVTILRGNHEDYHMNKNFGFVSELARKYEDIYPQRALSIFSFYELLPVALYLGSGNGDKNIIQCCHGGLELGYLPHNLFNNPAAIAFERIHKLNRATHFKTMSERMAQEPQDPDIAQPEEIIEYLQDIDKQEELSDFVPTDPQNPYTLGFTWHDFIAHRFGTQVNDEYLAYNFGRGGGFMYGYTLTQQFLKMSSDTNHAIRAVFRAHQHNDTTRPELWKTKGLFNLWNGLVFTFLSAPAAGLNFYYDSFATLQMAEDYADWTLTHYQRDVTKKAPSFSEDTGPFWYIGV